jgi:hypothetical protein
MSTDKSDKPEADTPTAEEEELTEDLTAPHAPEGEDGSSLFPSAVPAEGEGPLP